ncbi:hypothetical protein GCM10027449_01270 [Sinomonas notoginsengisoli]
MRLEPEEDERRDGEDPSAGAEEADDGAYGERREQRQGDHAELLGNGAANHVVRVCNTVGGMSKYPQGYTE